MIKIEETEVCGWEAAIRGMRNPMNSWDMSDTSFDCMVDGVPDGGIGEADLRLMRKLGNAGNDHSKYLRMIAVYCDITAPLYWWKEFDTYKVGTVANSCSTMHKIHAKEFTLEDFSFEDLFGDYKDIAAKEILNALNYARERYLATKEKIYWWQMIQLLPSSYNQKRTVMMNYQVLKNIYHSRRNHKLDEWHDFCAWIEELPYSDLITGGRNDERRSIKRTKRTC